MKFTDLEVNMRVEWCGKWHTVVGFTTIVYEACVQLNADGSHHVANYTQPYYDERVQSSEESYEIY